MTCACFSWLRRRTAAVSGQRTRWRRAGRKRSMSGWVQRREPRDARERLSLGILQGIKIPATQTHSHRQIRSTLGRSRWVPRTGLVACGAGSGGRVRCWRAVARWAGSPALAVRAALAGRPDGGQVSQPGCSSAPARVPDPGRGRRLQRGALAAGRCAAVRAAAAGRSDWRSGRLQPGRPPVGATSGPPGPRVMTR
jgi:hypothetical protein